MQICCSRVKRLSLIGTGLPENQPCYGRPTFPFPLLGVSGCQTTGHGTDGTGDGSADHRAHRGFGNFAFGGFGLHGLIRVCRH